MGTMTAGETATVRKQAPARPQPAAGRALCAEENKVIGPVLRMFLESAGYEVTLSGDGEEAWDQLNSKGADILITAHRLPGMTGLDLIIRARAEGLTLPVVLVVGSHEPLRREQLAELDVAGILVKPFSQQQLLAVMRKASRQKPGVPPRSKPQARASNTR